MTSRDRLVFEIAVERIRNGDPAIIEAAWSQIPSPYQIDVEDTAAMRQLLTAIVEAALVH